MNFLRVPPADPLAELTDADIARLQEPIHLETIQKPEPLWEKFRYDLYDWDDPEFKAKNKGIFSYVPIRLTRGYFMMVHKSRLKEMTQYPDGSPKKWFAHFHYDRNGEPDSVYAERRGRKALGEPACVSAHRELLRIIDNPSLVGDHANGLSFDNRCPVGYVVNLFAVSQSENMNNAVRSRRDGLPQGVERSGKEGNYRYNGKVCIRYGKKVVTIRSRRWKTPEPAARWYENYLKRRHKRTMWAHRPETVNMPLFPPLKPEYRIQHTTPFVFVASSESFELEATF